MEAATATQKLANLLVTSCRYCIKREELKETCGLNPNMIAKAFNSKLVKAIAIAKGWERKKSFDVLGYGRGFVLVNESLSNQDVSSMSYESTSWLYISLKILKIILTAVDYDVIGDNK